jgi:hypothetical protein
MTTLSSNSYQMLKKPGCFMQDRNNHVNEQIVEKLLPGSLVYDIINAKYKPEPERPPFYVQNKKDYLESLERNCKKMGIPFKKPNVEEIQPIQKKCTNAENHIDYLDSIVLKTTVLKNGKVKVKLIPQMAILNENYYSKYKIPPIKSVLSVLKSHGYSNEYIQSVKDKHKKRNKLIEVKWRKLEKLFDKTSIKRKKTKKKEVVEEDLVEDIPEENKEDDEPEEDEAIEIDDEDEEEVVEEDYVSDGGDD